jgi:hypothetical protein
MNIKVGLAELLIVSSAMLGCVGQAMPMWVFFGTGLMVAFCRFALENQEKAQQRKFLEDNADNLKSAASELGNLFGLKTGSQFRGGTMH